MWSKLFNAGVLEDSKGPHYENIGYVVNNKAFRYFQQKNTKNKKIFESRKHHKERVKRTLDVMVMDF